MSTSVSSVSEFVTDIAESTVSTLVPTTPQSAPQEDEKKPIDPAIWAEIIEDYDKSKAEVEKYVFSKSPDSAIETNPAIAYLNPVLPLIKTGLFEILSKAKLYNSCKRPTTTFDGIDFLSEYLFNMNPLHPERRKNWTYIFDMEFVKDHLKDNPRPFYPFHRIWTREVAAMKIQAFVRGYWSRRQKSFEEIRSFWKDIDHDTGTSKA